MGRCLRVGCARFLLRVLDDQRQLTYAPTLRHHRLIDENFNERRFRCLSKCRARVKADPALHSQNGTHRSVQHPTGWSRPTPAALIMPRVSVDRMPGGLQNRSGPKSPFRLTPVCAGSHFLPGVHSGKGAAAAARALGHERRPFKRHHGHFYQSFVCVTVSKASLQSSEASQPTVRCPGADF